MTIEALQLLFSSLGLVQPQIFDVDDVILNTFGGVIGYYAGKRVLQRWLGGFYREIMIRKGKATHPTGHEKE